MKWQNVYIFISSTFNDMHAERDYLIKRVFPALRLWCAEHKLKLIDIDLRWGVSEKDATENKRVVDVCLNNVDKCRPFLLSLLGQRRGWIPGIADINPDTLLKYPGLKEYIGRQSITELEIIHGLLHPLADGTAGMRHAFFYHRQPDYIGHIASEEIRRVFELETDDTFMETLKESYDVTDYSAEWNPEIISPELKNVQGKDLSQGRLEHFLVDHIPLSAVVTAQLKAAIQEEYPEHFAAQEELDDLGRELNHQDNFLFSACDSYIPRLNEEAKVVEYFNGNLSKPCILTANAGAGKTSMLAWLIRENRIPGTVIYRFLGTSSASSDIVYTLHQLAEEFFRRELITQEDLIDAKTNISLKFPALLKKLKGKCSIILDAADQCSHISPASFRWLPEKLPDHVKILLSIKKDGQAEIISHLTKKDYLITELGSLSADAEKRAIIVGYLASFLKDIDDRQIGHILRLPGSGNPLYLKIVLNELRIHGSFDTLMEQLQKDYGTTPQEAFQMVLNRLETESFGAGIPAADLVKYVLGTISHSTEGVLVEEFATICKYSVPNCKKFPKEAVMDSVYGLVRHLSAYLMIDGNRVNFLYDSFRRAVQERYQEHYAQFHNLLATIYSRYCYTTGGAEYDVPKATHLTNSIYHAIACAKGWVEGLLTDPWFVYRLVSKTSAGQTADYFRAVADKYEDSEAYREIADFMERYSMRLNIGPNTLFDLMKRRIGLKNPLVCQLCSRASKVMELEYFYPAREEYAASLSADRELHLYTGGEDMLFKPEPFIWGQYVIYTEGDTVLMQNIYTEEIEKQTVLPDKIYRAYVYGDFLYVHYYNEEYAAIETFRLPGMESVFSRKDRPELPEGFHWYTIACGIDGVQYQYATSDNKDRPEMYVYNLNTGTVQIHSAFPEDTIRKTDYCSHKVRFCNEYLMETVDIFRKCRVWHIPSGTLLSETDGELYHYITSRDQDMWYITVTDEGHLTARHYRKEDDAGVSLVGQYEITHKSLFRTEQIGILDGNVYLFFNTGDFWIFDQNFRFIGRQKVPFTVSHYSAGSFSGNQFLYYDQDYLYFHISSQLMLFDRQTCMKSLLHDMECSQYTEPFTTLQIDNQLVLLARHACHILNLNTLRYRHSTNYPAFPFYDPTVIDLGYFRYIIDTWNDSEEFAVLMINSYNLSVALQFLSSIPTGARKPEFAFYRDGIVGVVFWDVGKHERDVREHNSNPFNTGSNAPKEPTIERKEFKTFTIAYYDARNNFECIDVWKPDLLADIQSAMYYTFDSTPYLVFSNVYADTDHSEIRIYHAITKELVFSYRYDHTHNGTDSKDDFYTDGEHLFIRRFRYGTAKHYFTEIDIRQQTVQEFPIPADSIRGRTGKEWYFYSSFDNAILIFDMDKKEVTHEIKPRLHRFCYRVIRKGNRLVICLSGGVCEVYDAQTLQYLYSQMLLPNYSRVRDLPDTDLIFTSMDTSDYVIFKSGSTRDLMNY